MIFMFKYQLSKNSIFGYSFCTNDEINEEDLLKIIINEYNKIKEFDPSKIVKSLIENDYRFTKVPNDQRFKDYECKIIMIDDNDIISFNIMKISAKIVRGVC